MKELEPRKMTLSTEESHWKRHPFVGAERGHARPQVPIKDFLHQVEKRVILRKSI